MDAVVQFVRNLLCCVKDLDLFRSTAPLLYDANVTQSYYDFPEPLHKTTPLEVLISLSQLYAFLSTTISGLKCMVSHYGKFHRVQRLIELRKPVKHQADRLVNASLISEARNALRGMFVSLNVFFIGLAFFWLFANSWHVSETDWIGGYAGLIHSLAIMELALIPLLYYMYKDGNSQLKKAVSLRAMAASIERTDKMIQEEASVDLATLEALSDWKPFWEQGVYNFFDAVDLMLEEKQLKEETETVASILAKLQKTNTDTEKEAKILREAMIADLQIQARVASWQGYREYAYFLLNFVAFYGYLMPILTFYYYEQETQPIMVQRMKFHFDNADADWHGNFAGDLAWTIEPVIILASPLFLNYISSSASTSSSSKKKVKAE